MPLENPQRSWSLISLDFLTGLPESEGDTVVLVTMHSLNLPLPSLPTALETAKLIFNYLFRYYGIPEDRGPQFTSHVWKEFMEKLGVNISLTSGFHPQSNGHTERVTQEIGCYLRTYCSDNQNDWVRYLT